jgi:glyoxylase-like metal-dependent hydrolase (beta-lactamase superfamily II)
MICDFGFLVAACRPNGVSQSQIQNQQSKMSFTQLTPHLHVMQCRSMHYNTGAFISDGEAALIDPGLFADEFDALRALLAEQKAEPRWLILTHSHWDHVLGPEQFPGVTVVAHNRYREWALADADYIRWALNDWWGRAGVMRAAPFDVPLPDVTVGDLGTLSVGAITLELRHVPGHAADQLAVYHAETGALWASDLLSDSEIPYVSDNLRDYGLTLERLAGWEIGTLVPGHGGWTNDPDDIRARIAGDQAYLWELGSRVAAALHAGQSIEATVAACAAMPYRRYPNCEFDHQLNVESVYLELGGRADATRYGWNKDWRKAERQWE